MLFIANIKREYFKLSLPNVQVKMKLRINENRAGNKQFVLTGYRFNRTFKGVFLIDWTEKMLVYLDHEVEDEFEYNKQNADGSDNV
jgi:hypothetical protein